MPELAEATIQKPTLLQVDMDMENRTLVGNGSWRGKHKVANTLFWKQDDKLITHVGTQGQAHQLDYLLTDNWSRSKLKDAEASTCVDLGSDHLALRVCFDFTKPARNKSRIIHALRKAKWPPNDIDKYLSKLHILLEDAQVTLALEDKYEKIETALVEASQYEKDAQRKLLEEGSLLDQLIDERKAVPRADAKKRTAISKRIKRELRRRKEEEISEKINVIMSSFQTFGS